VLTNLDGLLWATYRHLTFSLRILAS